MYTNQLRLFEKVSKIDKGELLKLVELRKEFNKRMYEAKHQYHLAKEEIQDEKKNLDEQDKERQKKNLNFVRNRVCFVASTLSETESNALTDTINEFIQSQSVNSPLFYIYENALKLSKLEHNHLVNMRELHLDYINKVMDVIHRFNYLMDESGLTCQEFYNVNSSNRDHLNFLTISNNKPLKLMKFDKVVMYNNGMAFFEDEEEKAEMVNLCERYKDELMEVFREKFNEDIDEFYDMMGFSPIQEFYTGHFIRTVSDNLEDDKVIYENSNVEVVSGEWYFDLHLIDDKLQLFLKFHNRYRHM